METWTKQLSFLEKKDYQKSMYIFLLFSAIYFIRQSEILVDFGIIALNFTSYLMVIPLYFIYRYSRLEEKNDGIIK
jgi:hypothetical protein